MTRGSLIFNLGARTKTVCAGVVVLALLTLPIAESRAALGPPNISTPGQNSLQPGAHPTAVRIKGTAPADSTVELFDAASGSLGTTTATSAGTWSKNATFTNGTHTLNAVASSAEGTSLPSQAITFDVDAVKPAIAVGSPAEENHTFGAGELPTFTGTATDDRGIFAVRMRYWRLDKILLEKLATCDGCGSPAINWSDQPALPPGYYVMTATSIDNAGNQSELGRRNFATGLEGVPMSSLPAAPTVPGAPAVDVPTPTSPNPNQLIGGAERPIPLSGSGEPNSTVEAYETKAGLGPLGSVQSDNKGKWRMNVVLPSGAYAVTFRTHDEDGSVSPWSELLPFKVDADRPLLELITGDNTTFLPLQTVTLQGQSSDNRGVRYVIVDYWLGNELVARTLASCTGCPRKDISWTSSPELTDPGYYLARVKSIDRAGNTSFVDELHFFRTV